MDEEASIILGDAIAFCQRDGQDARLINMLGQSRAISLTEDTLTIEPPRALPSRSSKSISRLLRPIWKKSPLLRSRSTSWHRKAQRPNLLPRRCPPRLPLLPRRRQPPQATCRQSSTSTAMFPAKPWHRCRPPLRRQRTHPSRTCPSLMTQRRARIRALQSRTRSRPMIFVA